MTLSNLLTESAAASLAHKIVRAELVKANEPKAAQLVGCSMFDLMQRAGQAAFNLLQDQWPNAQKILVVTGTGNNGGDGYVVARLALQAGLQVSLVSQDPNKPLSADAKQAQTNWHAAGGQTVTVETIDFAHFDLIIDALLGTGLQGSVKPSAQTMIEKMNHAGVPILCIDLPSGMLANSGQASPVCVKATCTITFVAIKPGLVTGIGKDHCQTLVFNDLAIGDAFFQQISEQIQAVNWSMLAPQPPRPLHSHKGAFGKLLCIGGNEGMAGAIRLTAEAALRSGIGLVKAFCHPTSSLLVGGGRPEIMLRHHDLSNALDWSTCIVIGPGLGTDDWAHQQFSQLFDYLGNHPKPLVVDADGLNLLATLIEQPKYQDILKKLPALIVSPHPKEASRLLQSTMPNIENNRYLASANIAKHYFSTCILKGAGTIIHDVNTSKNGSTWVCTGGNPGMATAGMGDLLSGILGAFLGQGFTSEAAAVSAVCIHAEAADRLALQHGQRGMISSDLLPPLRALVNGR